MKNETSDQTDSAVFRIDFGVGCWDFGLIAPIHGMLSFDEYIIRLKRGLEAIPSLNNLHIIPFESKELKLSIEYATILDGESVVLCRGLMRYIKFDLYIPFRIQEEILKPIKFPLTETENFRIHIRYPYHGAVSYVELVKTEKSFHPSTAVMIVREYIKRQLDQHSTELMFTSIGPSPFHADFHVEGYVSQRRNDEKLSCEMEDRRGYADVMFRFRDDHVCTAEDAFRVLFHCLDDEFDLFYELRRKDRDLHERWNDMKELTENVALNVAFESWHERLRTWHSHNRDLAQLNLNLARFQTDTIFLYHHLDQAYRSTYRESSPTYLKSFVDDSLKERYDFPTKQLLDLLSFIEGRRSKQVEVLVILVSAIIGGVLGSIVTLFASGG